MKIEIKKSNEMAQALEFRAKIIKNCFGVENDFDKWDCVAYHICCSNDSGIVGYYRVIPDTELKFYTETEFDVRNLGIAREEILELGRACIDPAQRNPVIIPMLWSAVIDLSKKLGKKHIMGAASLLPSETNIYKARDAWREKYQYLNGSHAVPLNPFTNKCSDNENVPNLIKVYEKVGAKIVSDPSYDPIFKTADVVTILNVGEMNERWMKKLIKRD